MRLFAETVEEVREEAANVRDLFDGDRRVRTAAPRSPEYLRQLTEAASLIERVERGRSPMYLLQEAMGTDDFPLLFADILDRQLLANYREIEPVYQAYTRQGRVPDLRNVKRFAVDGAEGQLEEVGELEEYPEAALQESKDEYRVKKYGRRLDWSWEMGINDDLDAFRDAPQRLARGARRSEQKFVTTLYVDSTGPHASLYDASNTVTGNPALTLAAFQLAMQLLGEQRDEDDEPIVVEMVHLVVPPALEVVANNIINAIQIEMTEAGGTAGQKLIAKNWMAGRVQVHVDPYIPIVSDSANGNTTWFLFADPNAGRPAIEFGKLRGFEDPGLFEKIPDSRRVGGGEEATESFDTDSRAYKVRHVYGGTRLTSTGGKKATVASEGDGS